MNMVRPGLLWLCLFQLLYETASLPSHDFLHLMLLCTAKNKYANSTTCIIHIPIKVRTWVKCGYVDLLSGKM